MADIEEGGHLMPEFDDAEPDTDESDELELYAAELAAAVAAFGVPVLEPGEFR